jgi:hypothetical protein
VEATLPDGRLHRGRLRRHVSKGEVWYEDLSAALVRDPGAAALDEQLNADGALPAVRPPYFNVWPLQMKVSPSPLRKRGEAGADYLGLLWVSAKDGCPGGEVYRVVAHTRSGELLLKGYVETYSRPA